MRGDNNNVVGETQKETERAMQFALLVYRFAGWNIQWKKTTTKAEQQASQVPGCADRYKEDGIQIATRQGERRTGQCEQGMATRTQRRADDSQESIRDVREVGGLQDHTRTSVAH